MPASANPEPGRFTAGAKRAGGLLIGLGVLALLPAPCAAEGSGVPCSCPRSETEQQEIERNLESSAAVFAGRVLEVDRPADSEVASCMESAAEDARYDCGMMTVRFRVISAWKGVADREATILTHRWGPSCGYGFEVGRRYLVYAHTVKHAMLPRVSSCSRTRELRRAELDQAILGPPSYRRGGA